MCRIRSIWLRKHLTAHFMALRSERSVGLVSSLHRNIHDMDRLFNLTGGRKCQELMKYTYPPKLHA